MKPAIASSINGSSAGDGGRPVTVLGVDYHHVKQDNGGDLYLTRYGLAFRECLRPENWFDPAWFRSKRQQLLGTSTICKMPTKPVDGRSLDLVVRYSRMGERVPADTDTLCRNVNSEANSPFVEVSLVMELRAGQFGPSIQETDGCPRESSVGSQFQGIASKRDWPG